MSKECNHFFTDPDTPDQVPGEVDLYMASQRMIPHDTTYCYPEVNPENQSMGGARQRGTFMIQRGQMKNTKEGASVGKIASLILILITSTMRKIMLRSYRRNSVMPSLQDLLRKLWR